ncbi:DksA protein [Piscirickettsia salmonis]|uniref:Prokaryotic DksA/TraR C4-type zinc finger family protein n=1 Tax=Piscirickettsia salmonis TaxID=1238 RepID=A0A095BQL5_PISSA|nr:TraR/DksA C4-type zinc finger protein [Piscirickettsia salmonis]RNC76893.1 DksA protein [Piscirickettsiaceae bacterium NZ-RLO2]AKP72551.1 DksA protein [Piscirickettsia salmonis LF-89 = ATCC VR-1361]ALA23840.1 prokaryotic dksA/traR C4-type zinc finger family protein [Piscirickettsia salmonis]ALB23973.1 prokaryotic DksA/TraR C4-type zinc finger family protein [Piscirickettsia salmonis]ALY03792.1 DksA protein [Piscirickettsia salmonis]
MITKEELLKMPASDYMNDQQLEFFAHLLKEEKEETLEEIDMARAALTELENNPADEADAAAAEEQRQLQLRIVSRKTNYFKHIERAQARIDDKSYGFCEETDEMIGLQRLMYRPTSTLSVEAQESKERRKSLHKDVRDV